MANTKITDLTAATSVSGTDTIPLVQGGVTKKAAVSLLPTGLTTEQVQDAVAAMVVAGTNVTSWVYDDTAGTLTLNVAGGGGATDPEVVRDTIAASLVAGTGVTVTVNDAADTITIAAATVDRGGVYIPQGSLSTLKTALAATSTQLVEIPYFGDSTGKGTGAVGGGIVPALRTLALAAGLTDGGRGLASLSETAATSGENLDPILSRTGFSVTGGGSDFIITDTPVSATAGDVVTFQGKGTRVRIYYTIQQGTTGRFTYSIDGAAAVTVDASKATDGATTTTVASVYVGGLTEGTHTVAITNLGDKPVNAPTQIVTGGSSTGGTLPIGTYYYRATAVTAAGETTISDTSAASGVATNTSKVTVSVLRVTGATAYRVYRSTSANGTYGLIGQVTDPGTGSYAAFDDTGATTPGAVPPATNTAGAVGTNATCRVAAEFVRAAGIVLHKQAVSGISSGSFFNSALSTNANQPNAPAQKALGLKTGTTSAAGGVDWAQTPDTKPNTRNVKSAIFALGLNDVNTSDATAARTSIEGLAESFGLFVRMCRSAGADPILVVEHFDYYPTSVNSLNNARARSALTSIARSMSVPYVDLNVALGSLSTGGALWGTGPHINQAGYDVEAAFVWNNIFAPLLAG